MFKEYREKLNLTVEELASLTYLDETTIKKIQAGKRRPRLTTAKKLIKALDISKEDVYNYYLNIKGSEK